MNFLKYFKFFGIISFLVFGLFLFSVNLVEAGDMRAECVCTRPGDRSISKGSIEARTYEGLEGRCQELCLADRIRDYSARDPVCVNPEEVLPERRNDSCAMPTVAPSPEEKEEIKKEAPLESLSKLKKISFSDPAALIGTVLRVVLGLTGSIALLMFVYGGFLWLTSGGSPDKIKKAQGILVWATLGLLLIFGSYTIVDKILSTFS